MSLNADIYFNTLSLILLNDLDVLVIKLHPYLIKILNLRPFITRTSFNAILMFADFFACHAINL